MDDFTEFFPVILGILVVYLIIQNYKNKELEKEESLKKRRESYKKKKESERKKRDLALKETERKKREAAEKRVAALKETERKKKLYEKSKAVQEKKKRESAEKRAAALKETEIKDKKRREQQEQERKKKELERQRIIDEKNKNGYYIKDEKLTTAKGPFTQQDIQSMLDENKIDLKTKIKKGIDTKTFKLVVKHKEFTEGFEDFL